MSLATLVNTALYFKIAKVHLLLAICNMSVFTLVVQRIKQICILVKLFSFTYSVYISYYSYVLITSIAIPKIINTPKV